MAFWFIAIAGGVLLLIFVGSFAVILATANKAAIALFSAGVLGLVVLVLVLYVIFKGKEVRQWIKMLRSS
jgi:hypothetical protein